MNYLFRESGMLKLDFKSGSTTSTTLSFGTRKFTERVHVLMGIKHQKKLVRFNLKLALLLLLKTGIEASSNKRDSIKDARFLLWCSTLSILRRCNIVTRRNFQLRNA